ncbi:MAG: hypothetical protein NPIRA04_03960 [Nitrospirales bacterium]|nr:MAG: hypothetical protein NPIRA04_03960 [Nitrospirales bacterium]
MLAEIIPGIANFNWQPSRYRPRPSSSGPTQCSRKLTYKALGYPERKPGDRFAVVLDDSSWHEELTCQWIEQSTFKLHSQQMPITIPKALPWLIDTERPFTCNMCGETVQPGSLHGHIDGICTDLFFEDYLFEHKAINHFTFETYRKGAWPVDHLTQCVLYFEGLHDVQPDLNKAILLIKNKNTSGYLEYVIQYDFHAKILTILEVTASDGTIIELGNPLPTFVNLLQDALDQFATIEHHRQAGTLPPREYEPQEWQCEYCPFFEPCWKSVKLNTEQSLKLTKDSEKLAFELHARTEERKRVEKEEDKLKRAFRLLLKNHGVQRATGPTITVRLKEGQRTAVNQDLIPPETLAAARTTTTIEKLQVTPHAVTVKTKTPQSAYLPVINQ